ncbi:MAG: hypothetical protein IBX50_08595 [Marinospirillum sp.]|uniref:hypothetical protein n=1 Tax=Marinospirillum sp. TaxID=2183934 RepID=UPI001A10606E|nr:hypothetical protein [Marinospirillum sp.]MBE0506765.1 hypothetical protein [Marinospirillum sp.]
MEQFPCAERIWKQRAKEWLNNNLMDSGFVMFQDHKAVGWCRELPQAEEWPAGTVAADPEYGVWLSIGGTAESSERWVTVR